MKSCIGLTSRHKRNSSKIFPKIRTLFRITKLQMLTTSLIQQMRSRNKSSASQFTKQQNTRRIIHKLHKCHYKLLLVNTVDFIHVFYDYKFTIYVSDSQHSATMSMERDPMKDDPSVIKVRGLPWEATAMDLCKFFRDCDIVGGNNTLLSLASQYSFYSPLIGS